MTEFGILDQKGTLERAGIFDLDNIRLGVAHISGRLKSTGKTKAEMNMDDRVESGPMF
jgi:hypothetical protein